MLPTSTHYKSTSAFSLRMPPILSRSPAPGTNNGSRAHPMGNIQTILRTSDPTTAGQQQQLRDCQKLLSLRRSLLYEVIDEDRAMKKRVEELRAKARESAGELKKHKDEYRELKSKHRDLVKSKAECDTEVKRLSDEIKLLVDQPLATGCTVG